MRTWRIDILNLKGKWKPLIWRETRELCRNSVTRLKDYDKINGGHIYKYRIQRDWEGPEV